MIELVFWAGLVLLVYTYVGYPLGVILYARARRREVERAAWEPAVTLIVVAQDEAPRIAQRICNLLSLDYPRDKLRVIVASDGSVDDTVERALSLEDDRLRVIAFDERRGKPAVLADVMRDVRDEIVALADARQRFDPGALRALVAPLADPRVGAVSGELLLASPGAAVGEGVGFYWRYEKAIRRAESAIDSTVGATGAIYAIRRALWSAIPFDTILDDVWLPMSIVRRGYRVVFAPAARAFDRAPLSAREEFRRKVRTIAGNFQLLCRERWLWSPLHNRLWLQTLSHKALRLAGPLLLATTFLANVTLAASPFYAGLLGAQSAFYAAALAGRAARQRKIRLLGVPYVFCMLNWATLVAFVRFVTGKQRVTWKTSTREHTSG